MSAYKVSRLAQGAGVSVHVVRDYVLRGLIRPASHTEGGHNLYDADALERLRFVRALVAVRREALTLLDRQLAGMVSEVRHRAIGDHHHG
ncbi:transcriptional regulator MerD [Burkholderiales bacterium GJ-E10]|nr:transcriptional regulator MerD [Burkholderiales bacterium GJ-E10]